SAENRSSTSRPRRGPRSRATDVAELASWNDTQTRAVIVDLVERVSSEGGFGLPPALGAGRDLRRRRTLWCEKPMLIDNRTCKRSAPSVRGVRVPGRRGRGRRGHG